MTSRRIDRTLMALGVVLILISSYQLFFAGREESSGLKLGTLTSTLSVVKTKNALSLDWRDASIGNDLTENQLIYTDNSSSAEVVFNEGNALEIGENSLVKLRAVGKEQGMDLSKGFIRAKLEGNKPLKVQMNGEDYLLSGKNADIQINIQEAKGEIGVLNGEVKIEGKGISENLNPETALAIDGEAIKKKAIYFRTLLPEKSAVLYVLNAPEPVTFTWEPAEDGKVLISKKPTMEKARTFEGTSGLTTDLNPGLWYYRVESYKGTSLISSFRLIQEKPVQVLRPKEGETVTVMEENKRVLLQWKGEAKDKFMVEWNDGETQSSIISGTSAQVNVLPERPFSWRVKIHDENRPLALWSDWQNVKVNFITKPLVPTDLVPHEVEYQTYDKPFEKIELNWKGQGPFELEIKDPSSKSNVENVQKVPSTFSTMTATMAGTYSWRVRAIDNYLRTSDWSDWKTFTIEDLSGKKGEEVQRVQLKKPDQSVTFNWQAGSGTTSVFELAKDPEFNKIVKKIEVNRDSTKVNIPEVGAYYWRSRQFLPDGTINVSEPKRVIIEPVPAPEKPEKLPDLEVPLEEMPVKTTLLENILNFIVPSAYADELKGMVHIQLPVKEEAKGYVLRIYRDKNLTDLVVEEKLASKEFEWKNAEAGVFYWQYAVIDFWDRQSLFSDPARLVIKGELVPLPEKPKLASPIRAVEVDQKDLVLRWTESKNGIRYKTEISEDDTFKKVLSSRETVKPNADFTDLKLEPKLYYWRVKVFNKKNKEVISNTGRFTLLPPLEKTIIEEGPKEYRKEWKSRAFIAWSPSMDSYTFTDGETGKISGTAMMGALVSGTKFTEKYAFSGELLRQTGKVFESQSYLFQRLQLDGVRIINSNPNHKIGLGLAVGQSSGQAYSIENSVVKGTTVSGLTYGVLFRNFLGINENWDMQGRAQYLLGEIKQMELGADAVRKYKSYLLLGGVSFASRSYNVSSGKQTSLRLSFGIGKEF